MIGKLDQIKLYFEKRRYRKQRTAPAAALLGSLFRNMRTAMLALADSDDAVRLWAKEAVRCFGLERGAETARKVRADGKEPTLYNFLAYGDLAPDGYDLEVRADKNEFEIIVSTCPFKRLAGPSANWYCDVIDHALLEGFAEDTRTATRRELNFELKHVPMHAARDGRCRLIYRRRA